MQIKNSVIASPNRPIECNYREWTLEEITCGRNFSSSAGDDDTDNDSRQSFYDMMDLLGLSDRDFM